MLAIKQRIFSCVASGVAPGSEVLTPRTTKKKTLYRVVGRNERRSIGETVSTGCIPVKNWPLVDHYNHLAKGASTVAS